LHGTDDFEEHTRARGLLLQGAVEDVSISGMLPSAAAIDAVLGGGATHQTPDSPDAKLLSEKLEEDLMVVQLFLARLHTLALLQWAAHGSVLLREWRWPHRVCATLFIVR